MNEIETYTFTDFAESDKPYAYIYQFRKDPFRMSQELERISTIARAVKYHNFKKTYKGYLAKMAEQNPIYIDGVTQFEGQELELNSGDWRADDLGISRMGRYGEEFACVHPIMPVERLINVDSGVEKLRLAYRKGGRWRHMVADKRTLASNNSILALADNGIAVNSENGHLMVQYLHDMESLNYELIPERRSVSRLGWIEDGGEMSFAPYIDDLVFDGDMSFKSIYDSIKSKGKWEKWQKIALDVRQMTVPARILLASAFASVLVAPMNALPFFVHTWGGTEAGKTVGLMLAVSVWGNPQKGKYWHTFDGTDVGNEKTAGFLNSLPLCIDELQIQNDKKSFDKMIYKLAEGVGRVRGSRSGGLQRLETWSCDILTTGEMPLANLHSGGGAVNRIIEIECKEKLFNDPKDIADRVSKHYGFAGQRFVEKLQEDGNLDFAKELYDEFFAQLVGGETTDKQAGSAALILTADALATEWLFEDDMALTADDIRPFLKTKSEVSVQDRAYEYVVEYCISNRNKFSGDSDDKEVWGKFRDNKVCIIRSRFNQICEEKQFSSTALLSWLKQKGLLELLRSAKGYTKAERINGESIHCVVLKLPEPEEETVELLDDLDF